MISEGKIVSSTLLWKKGTKDWLRADLIDSLKNEFIPPIPSDN